MIPFDDRIMKLVFTYGQGEVTTIDTSLGDPKRAPFIAASGSKYADVTQNECTVAIGNLPRLLRDQLATNLTQADYSKPRKSVEVWAGRVSSGMSLRYVGDILSGMPSQPPDIMMTFTSKTAQWFKHDVLAQSYTVTANSSQIASDIAKSMGYKLNFQATDKAVSNYSYTGSLAGQIQKLSDVGSMDVYVDDNTLVCKNKGEPLANTQYVLNVNSGLVGQIELTEWGIRAKCLLTSGVAIGGEIVIQSVQNPSLNGSYTVVKVGFELATRNEPFYEIIEATRYPAAYYSAVMPT